MLDQEEIARLHEIGERQVQELIAGSRVVPPSGSDPDSSQSDSVARGQLVAGTPGGADGL